MSKQDKQKAQQLGKKYQTPCHGIGDCEFEAYQSALEMAEWKDKQFNEEKNELIGLINMLPVDDHNQTIIEDLKALLR